MILEPKLVRTLCPPQLSGSRPLDVHFEDCAKLVDKPIATLRALFEYWFEFATFHRPTIIVLDDLDKLLPAEQEVSSLSRRDDVWNLSAFQQAPSFRARQLTSLFLEIFGGGARALPRDARGVVLIATARNLNSLHAQFRTSHLFPQTVSLGRLTKEGRKEVLPCPQDKALRRLIHFLDS
jgi:peroxin-1